MLTPVNDDAVQNPESLNMTLRKKSTNKLELILLILYMKKYTSQTVF